jgi:peroxiredoxin
MILHPRFRTLSRYMDADLSPPARSRVARHLASCPRCRATLTSLRALGTAAAGLPAPSPPADMAERILARRAAGERVILPHDRAPAHAPARRGMAAAAAVVFALLAGALLFLGTEELQAEGSELRFFPGIPVLGAEVSVEYRAASALAGEERLVLRARLRRPHDEDYDARVRYTRLTELERVGRGVYRGRFQLPDSVVYGVFAVENLDGSQVDSNGRRFWELLVHEPDGRPAFFALIQKIADLMGRDYEQAYHVSRSLGELYPERPYSWTSRRIFRSMLAIADTAEDRRDVERFRALSQSIAVRPQADPHDLAYLYLFAELLEDDSRDAWKARLFREHPRYPAAVLLRAQDLNDRFRSEPARLLEEADRLWDEAGPTHEALGFIGLPSAIRSGDPVAIRRWAERYPRVIPNSEADVAMRLLRVPAMRQEGMELLRRRIDDLAAVPESQRRLENTREAQRVADRQALAALQTTLARELIADGRVQEGGEVLDRAAAAAWSPDIFRQGAELQLQLGDTLRALRLLARTSVDPATDRMFQDTVASRFGSRFVPDEWQALLHEARREMHSRVSAGATARRLRAPVGLTDLAGVEHTLPTAAGGEVTVVAFWSRYCEPSLRQLPELQRLHARLREHGIRLLAVTQEAPSAELRAFLAERELELPVHSDSGREASRAFNQWATPSYFVLDRSGAIRFEYSRLDDVLRQAVVLSQASGE